MVPLLTGRTLFSYFECQSTYSELVGVILLGINVPSATKGAVIPAVVGEQMNLLFSVVDETFTEGYAN